MKKLTERQHEALREMGKIIDISLIGILGKKADFVITVSATLDDDEKQVEATLNMSNITDPGLVGGALIGGVCNQLGVDSEDFSAIVKRILAETETLKKEQQVH